MSSRPLSVLTLFSLLVSLGGCTSAGPDAEPEPIEPVAAEPPTPEEFWTHDELLDHALEARGEGAVSEEIETRLADALAQIRKADGSIDQSGAEAMVEAMRWAAIRIQSSALAVLDEVARAPRGPTSQRLRDGLTYTARWAAWRIRAIDMTPEERVDRLIADWRGQGLATPFAEHRLLELPGVSAPLIALAVDELLPGAGYFDNGELVVEDLASADLLSRVMTILEVRAERSEPEQAAFRRAFEGLGVEF